MELEGSSPHSQTPALMSLSWARSMQSTSAYPISWRCISGAIAKLRNANVYLRHVWLSAWKNSAPSRRIFMKFDIWIFLQNLSRKFNSLKSDKNNGDFTWRPVYIFFIICRWILRRMRNVSDKFVEKVKNTRFMFDNFFFSKIVYLWEVVENRWQYSTEHAHCMMDTQGYRSALRICNT